MGAEDVNNSVVLIRQIPCRNRNSIEQVTVVSRLRSVACALTQHCVADQIDHASYHRHFHRLHPAQSMAGSQIQPHQSQDTAMDTFQDDAPPADWGGGRSSAASESGGASLGRYLAAVRRFRWMIVLFTVLGAGDDHS